MELKKMREMTEVELNTELGKMKKELFNLRFQHVTGQLENPVQRPRLEKDHHQSDDHRGQRAEHEQQNKAGAQRGGGVLRR